MAKRKECITAPIIVECKARVLITGNIKVSVKFPTALYDALIARERAEAKYYPNVTLIVTKES
jgi:hypothetical protein